MSACSERERERERERELATWNIKVEWNSGFWWTQSDEDIFCGARKLQFEFQFTQMKDCFSRQARMAHMVAHQPEDSAIQV